MSYACQRLVATIALIVLSPVLLLISALIRARDGKPILFRQQRVGRGGNPFTIYKFRTMFVNADDLLQSRADTPSRITATGKWLRRSSLDELPQLLNIVRGEMTIVGPRALLPEVAANVPPQFRSRYDVLPGITGLAQVNGRNDLPWSRRLEYDVTYARERSLSLDCRILVKTVGVVLGGSGYRPDRTTAQTDDLGLLGGQPGHGEDNR